jgi:hypothetical protein
LAGSPLRRGEVEKWSQPHKRVVVLLLRKPSGLKSAAGRGGLAALVLEEDTGELLDQPPAGEVGQLVVDPDALAAPVDDPSLMQDRELL